MNTRDIIKQIIADGWFEVKTGGGSHRQFKHPIKRGRVTVPFHGNNQDLHPAIVKSIKRQANLP